MNSDRWNPASNTQHITPRVLTKEVSSPMPTCASKIMLTSLAPSPIARVMGCSFEALISFTICRSKKKKQRVSLTTSCHWARRLVFIPAGLSPALSAAAPCDSRARHYSCDRSQEICPCSCRARLPPGWASGLRTEWPRRWSDQNPGSRPTACRRASVKQTDQQSAGSILQWLNRPLRANLWDYMTRWFKAV